MSRLDPDNTRDYGGDVVFNLRAQDEGGMLSSQVNVVTRNPNSTARKNIYLLVHGFNNHRNEAESAFRGFRARQNNLRDTLSNEKLFSRFRDTFWPGDAKGYNVFDKLDFLVYPVSVGTSKQAGALLATHLIGNPVQGKINFIGHSLGCRVILETIKNYLSLGGSAQSIGTVCLLAAAVPIFKVVRGGELDQALHATDKTLCLFSRSDLVLRGAFPLGQTAAKGKEGFFPRAMGRFGINHPKISNKAIFGAAHGHYWGHAGDRYSEERKRARLANHYVAEFNKWGGLQNRTIDSRQAAYEKEAFAFESEYISRKRKLARYSRKTKTRPVGG